jgi:hypothetical protein
MFAPSVSEEQTPKIKTKPFQTKGISSHGRNLTRNNTI